MGVNPTWRAYQESIETIVGHLPTRLRRHAVDVLTVPVHETGVYARVELEGGCTTIVRAFRCIASDALGTPKGGFSAGEHVSGEIQYARTGTRTLAWGMALKTALCAEPVVLSFQKPGIDPAGQPLRLGGAKGFFGYDPKLYSPEDRRRIIRGLGRAFGRRSDLFGWRIDVPAPDAYTNAQDMVWFAEGYGEARGVYDPGVVTGKPIAHGGIPGRDEATGYWAFLCLVEAARRVGIDVGELRVGLQGFGNVASHCARFLHEAGACVLGVQDEHGSIQAGGGSGLNIPELCDWVRDAGTVHGFPGASAVDRFEWWTLPFNALVPAALPGSIALDKVESFHRDLRVVVAAANAPFLPGAPEHFQQRGGLLVSSDVGSLGGVIGSKAEMLSNHYAAPWTKDETLQFVSAYGMAALNAAWDRSESLPRIGDKPNLTLGARLVAATRILEATLG